MIEIHLTQGYTAVVDDDCAGLAAVPWFVIKGGVKRQHIYAARWQLHPERKLLLMHRVIMDAPDGAEVDHVDGNTLNNQRSNLRHSTHARQMWNMGSRGGSSKYVGVSWYPKYSKWVAKVGHNGKLLHVGYFTSEEEAAKARDRKAYELHGDLARTNFPLDIMFLEQVEKLLESVNG